MNSKNYSFPPVYFKLKVLKKKKRRKGKERRKERRNGKRKLFQ